MRSMLTVPTRELFRFPEERFYPPLGYQETKPVKVEGRYGKAEKKKIFECLFSRRGK